MTGSNYERELRDILRGEHEEHTKSLTVEKKRIYDILKDKPFLIVRGAGSLGYDLIAMRGNVYLPIEVKTSKAKTIYFSDDERLTEQIEEYIRLSELCDIPSVYARRMNGIRGERWELFRINSETANNLLWLIPPIPTTAKGSRKLPWGSGLPLSEFIEIWDNHSHIQFTTEVE